MLHYAIAIGICITKHCTSFGSKALMMRARRRVIFFCATDQTLVLFTNINVSRRVASTCRRLPRYALGPHRSLRRHQQVSPVFRINSVGCTRRTRACGVRWFLNHVGAILWMPSALQRERILDSLFSLSESLQNFFPYSHHECNREKRRYVVGSVCCLTH